MRRIKSRHSEKMLLKGLGFTFREAFRIVLFSMAYSAIGLGLFCVAARLSFDDSARVLSGKIVDTLVSISYLKAEDKELKETVISREPLNFYDLKSVGAEDMDINKKAPLVHVKGQRRFISENQDLIRFIRAD